MTQQNITLLSTLATLCNYHANHSLSSLFCSFNNYCGCLLHYFLTSHHDCYHSFLHNIYLLVLYYYRISLCTPPFRIAALHHLSLLTSWPVTMIGNISKYYYHFVLHPWNCPVIGDHNALQYFGCLLRIYLSLLTSRPVTMVGITNIIFLYPLVHVLAHFLSIVTDMPCQTVHVSN